MKKSEETLEDFAISYPLDKLAPLEQVLFLDIETTGFTSRTSYLYMIGCAYNRAGKWHTIQWMAEDYAQEGAILTAFSSSLPRGASVSPLIISFTYT